MQSYKPTGVVDLTLDVYSKSAVVPLYGKTRSSFISPTTEKLQQSGWQKRSGELVRKDQQISKHGISSSSNDYK